MYTTAAIALGGNVGHVPQIFQRALARLDLLPEIQLVGRSRNFETRAMGDDAGTPYVNAVALLQTTFTASQLLCHTQLIEAEFGRDRSLRWGPRTLDIDLLSFGNDTVCFAQTGEQNDRAGLEHVQHRPMDTYCGALLIPHPGCWYRRFVLDPWCDVSPNWKHPILNQTVRELRCTLMERPLNVCLGETGAEIFDSLRQQLEAEGLADQVRFVPADQERVHFAFDFNGQQFATSDQPRTISLQNSQSGIRLAMAVLHAALDQPIPCSSG